MNPWHKNIDALQITGFAISALVAFLTWAATGQRDLVGSLVLGFAMAALTQGFDVQKRIKDSEERVLKANALHVDLLRDPWLQDHVQPLVRDYLSVKAGWYDLFKLRAGDALVDCARVIHGMAEGTLVVPRSGPYSSGGYTIPKAKKSAKAVASINDAYWSSAEGETYVQENSTAIQRGVRFIRVFVYPANTLRKITGILKKHRELGVEVWVAPTEGLQTDLIEDYLIVDDRLLVSTESTGALQTHSTDMSTVDQAVRRFETLLRHALPLDQAMEKLLA